MTVQDMYGQTLKTSTRDGEIADAPGASGALRAIRSASRNLGRSCRMLCVRGSGGGLVLGWLRLRKHKHTHTHTHTH